MATTEKLNIIENTCPECFGEIIFAENKQICSICGLIYDEMIEFEENPMEITYKECAKKGKTYTMKQESLITIKEQLKLKSKSNLIFLQKSVQDKHAYYSKIISDICIHFSIESEKDRIEYLFKKTINIYKIPDNQRVHIPLIFASTIVVVSSLKRAISMSKILSYAKSIGHKVRFEDIRVVIKQYKILDDAYIHKNNPDRFSSYCTQIYTKYINDFRSKEFFYLLDTNNISYEIFQDLIKEKFNYLASKTFRFIKLKSINCYRYAFSLFFLTLINVSKEISNKRLITQTEYAEILNVNMLSIRTGKARVLKDLMEVGVNLDNI
jgi:hypothetical protein